MMNLIIKKRSARKGGAVKKVKTIDNNITLAELHELMGYLQNPSYTYELCLSNGWILKEYTAYTVSSMYDDIIAEFIRKGEWTA